MTYQDAFDAARVVCEVNGGPVYLIHAPGPGRRPSLAYGVVDDGGRLQWPDARVVARFTRIEPTKTQVEPGSVLPRS